MRYVALLIFLIFIVACSPAGLPDENTAQDISDPAKDKKQELKTTFYPDNESGLDPAMVIGGIAMYQIAEHDSADDCWMAVNGEVFDVTGFISSGAHPGGDAILEGCGTDATTLFEAKPGDGQPHSGKALLKLDEFYIGELQ